MGSIEMIRYHQRVNDNFKSGPRNPNGVSAVTPDGRYFVVRGRLWRVTNPMLLQRVRSDLVKRLMDARRAKGKAMRTGDLDGREKARQAIDEAKVQLGERGEVWWTDGAPDYNRRMVANTPYAEWFVRL
jgi:hypothetical protein